MKTRYIGAILVLCLSGMLGMSTTSQAATNFDFDITVEGVDAIFLAGRSDVLPIPAPNKNPNAFILQRHSYLVPEFPLVETLPPSIPVSPGGVVTLVNRAIGGISFFNGFNGSITGPEGGPGLGSNISGLGRISGYKGPEGALVGVFLSDSVPRRGTAPAILDFTLTGLGTNFTSLSPKLLQVFFIGDGFTDNGAKQSFKVPASATRLVLGIADAFNFDGVPGAYEDNNGAYMLRIRLSIP